MSSQLTIEEYTYIKSVVYDKYPDVIADIIGQYQSKEEFSECERCSGYGNEMVKREVVEKGEGFYEEENKETDEDTGFTILCCPCCSECDRILCLECWGERTYDSTCEKCGKKEDRKEIGRASCRERV